VQYEDASRDFWRYLSVRTVERLGLQPGERVLDVPCGTGHSLLVAAHAVGPAGLVVGLDVAPRMLAIAREKVDAAGLSNVDIQLGDMTAIRRPEDPYDAVICVLGLFFADDMPTLARSFVDLVRPEGGRVAVTVFGEHFVDPLREVFVRAVHEVARGLDVVQPWGRTADMASLRRVFDGAGAGALTIDTEDDSTPLPTGDDWWRVVMGSGLRATVTALGPELAAAVRARGDARIAREGIDHVVTRSRYAVFERRPSFP
jgi:SAM-dependent methyltransferase